MVTFSDFSRKSRKQQRVFSVYVLISYNQKVTVKLYNHDSKSYAVENILF